MINVDWNSDYLWEQCFKSGIDPWGDDYVEEEDVNESAVCGRSGEEGVQES